MTYCVAVRNEHGLVFLSDSRTNAGVDQVGTFRKMHVFEVPGERVMVLLTAGNLGISQSIASGLRAHMAKPGERSLASAPNMFSAAKAVGDAVRRTYQRDAESLKTFDIEFNVSFIFGGQVKGEEPRLFHIYAAGNFVEATAETPYFQLGESKYGKPILDRIIQRDTSLSDAAKCALISFDSTMRSNVSVGPPIDLLIYRRNSLKKDFMTRLEDDDPYLQAIREGWGGAIHKAFHAISHDSGWTF